MYSLSGIKSWTKDQRSNIPAYDRIFNETMAPILERRMGLLLNNPNFKKLSLTEKRSRVNKEVQVIRSMVRDVVEVSSTGEDYLQVLRKKALSNGSSEQRARAMSEMRDMGFKANIKDFNWDELRIFNAKVDLQKIKAQPYSPLQ